MKLIAAMLVVSLILLGCVSQQDSINETQAKMPEQQTEVNQTAEVDKKEGNTTDSVVSCDEICINADKCWITDKKVCSDCDTSCKGCDASEIRCNELDVKCNLCGDESCSDCVEVTKCWEGNVEACALCDSSCPECEEYDVKCEELDKNCSSCRGEIIISETEFIQDDAVVPSPAISLSEVKTWLYQLQNLDPNSVSKTDFDLVVMDYTQDGTDETRYTTKQLNTIRGSNKKLILAYLSIGEAEEYRGYWKKEWKVGNPSFLDLENSDWPGNYKVKYWDPEWQDIVFRDVDKIVDRGFNGVYLDIIDAYEYYVYDAPEQYSGSLTPEKDMVEFVKAISERAKAKNPEFLVFPQNGESLVNYTDYLAAIDGLGKEDTWYNGNLVQNSNYTQNSLQFLNVVVDGGKSVLAIDYPTENEKACDFYDKCAGKGFVCTVSERELNTSKPVLCK